MVNLYYYSGWIFGVGCWYLWVTKRTRYILPWIFVVMAMETVCEPVQPKTEVIQQKLVKLT